jgi:pimeloyl-ACP methyl ester carboxylesterase
MSQRLVGTVLFPAPKPSYTIDSFPGELIWVPKGPVLDEETGKTSDENSSDYVPLMLLTYESARFLIMYFHSNAEDLGGCRWFCHFLREQFQVHVLAVEYPGYGVCPGSYTGCEAIMSNAHAALQFATRGLKLPLDRIKLFGRSIGTGPTLALAAKFKVSGVILVTPFISIRELFREKVGPLARMVEEWFPNDEHIKAVKSPTIFIHGRQDRLIPCAHSETLYGSCSSRKLFINPQEMEHNTNLTCDVAFLVVPMFRFFSLPDYSFQELKIPTWAFDKRRSPFYVRPEVQVSSHTEQVSVFNSSKELSIGTMSVPLGDDADTPLDDTPDQDSLRCGTRLPQTRGDSALNDTEKVPTAVLTQPTVLHAYSATKQRYHFKDSKGGATALERQSLLETASDTKPASLSSSYAHHGGGHGGG